MSHPSFTCLRQTCINSLNIQVEAYRHAATGARHLHLAAEDSNNTFLVAFLTVPQDSTGIAHILEHTTLCGSQRYPVRDPFFMMTRRSLNTFMNAFTSSDWTAYPFASQNAKDFDNLLQVYLDAVFFPRLDPLDFAQEGHRLEFATLDDANTPLMYKGVVFNEMKGAMSSAINVLLQTIQAHLFPTITYHHNSGGDPKEIPKLTYAQLKAFHASHYHPSNAIFMTYGDRPATDHQQLFETCALKHFQALDLRLGVPNERRYTTPQYITETYAIGESEPRKNKTHIVLAWLLGPSTDIREVINVSLLTGVLLDNSASPLRYALESSDLGTAPSPLCGLDDNTREASFICGLEGSEPKQADAVEALILDVLQQVVQQGVPQAQIDAILHQIELNQREITGDHFPYGLHLLVNVLSPMIHGGDPFAFLDIDPVLEALRVDCQEPQFIPQLIQRLLLDNPHRVRLVMAPDPDLAAQQLKIETEQLATLKATMDAETQAKLVEQAVALEKRQQMSDDPELLPKVGLDDISDELKIPEGTTHPVAHMPTTWFARGTNGMIYQVIVIDLPELSPALAELLVLFCDCLTDVGCGSKDYREMAAWQAAVTGGINARISLRGGVEDVQTVRGVFSLSGKALARNQAHLTELLGHILENARFDELPRLRELIAQLRIDSDNHITARGHHLVMGACTSGISLAGQLYHQWHGLAGLQKLRALDDSLADETALQQLATQFETIRTQLLTAPRQLLVVSEAEHHTTIATGLTHYWQDRAEVLQTPTSFAPSLRPQTIQQAWCTHTQVNFCAKAYPTVAANHPDAAVLTVLGDFLRHGYLHRAIREQGGAYGGGAHYDSDTGSFRFYSYRDPHLAETLTEFDRALQWLQEAEHESRALEEAILGVISRIDRPGSPAGEAINSFFNTLHGRTPSQRREFRRRVLQVTLADLQRVGATYLQPQCAHTAVLSQGEKIAQSQTLTLEQRVL